MTDKTYSQSDLTAELLKQHERYCEKRNESNEKRFDRLENKVDSHFRWMFGLVSGLYILVASAIVVPAIKTAVATENVAVETASDVAAQSPTEN